MTGPISTGHGCSCNVAEARKRGQKGKQSGRNWYSTVGTSTYWTAFPHLDRGDILHVFLACIRLWLFFLRLRTLSDAHHRPPSLPILCTSIFAHYRQVYRNLEANKQYRTNFLLQKLIALQAQKSRKSLAPPLLVWPTNHSIKIQVGVVVGTHPESTDYCCYTETDRRSWETPTQKGKKHQAHTYFFHNFVRNPTNTLLSLLAQPQLFHSLVHSHLPTTPPPSITPPSTSIP